MPRASKYLMRSRTRPSEKESWTAWETLAKEDTDTLAREYLTALVDQRSNQEHSDENIQFAIFHEGKIIAWYQGGKDISKTSRQAPSPAQVALASADYEYDYYDFYRPDKMTTVAIIAACDDETARRLLRNSVWVGREYDGEVITNGSGGWDLQMICVRKAPEPGPRPTTRFNHIVLIDSGKAPRYSEETAR